MKDKTIIVKVDRIYKEFVQKKAESKGLGVSAYIRNLIYLDEIKNNSKRG